MKKINRLLALCAVLALLLAGCSKEESSVRPEDNLTFAELTFEATLNDLVNRAAAVNKDHLDDIPDCSVTEPAYVELEISYTGQAPETTGVITLDILKDGDGYFTEYSELLKIPVANNGEVTVSLDSFVVYNSEGVKIWIAPMESAGDFSGYVDDPLPVLFQVQDGTKPYIDVEVLCFDNRMVNEYGYVFFELENTELIEFCIFGNFCPPPGLRHALASYSVAVWTVDDQDQILDQLYTNEELFSKIEENDAGELAADPVCMVLPDKLGEEDRYRIEITIEEGPDAGQVIRTSILSDLEVRTFFDGDDNLEYFHFFEGCDEPDTPPIFDDPRDNRMTYKTCVKELNDSGVIALAAVSIKGSILDVTILATGMEPGKHPQHIHGKDGMDAVCPPESASGDDDIITLTEGVPFYGGVRLGLDMPGGDFPTADAMGNYIYQRTRTLSADQKAGLTPLDQKVIVLHGIGEDLLPVACGELEKIE
ncbi:hypothetical protein [Christiangramia sabulilitoris]|uniref:CHRD domain-containing protein n=1 Tax=Christiangramia sabulilitoris TaxID=2583991 RepID=A0A550I2G9_9FLAO|nr:hypothetical protein [Christiangramia sabulilitoris]TRO65141.1 hypothetical protein FGM01_06960 [Christiangramia sabulilitoris]